MLDTGLREEVFGGHAAGEGGDEGGCASGDAGGLRFLKRGAVAGGGFAGHALEEDVAFGVLGEGGDAEFADEGCEVGLCLGPEPGGAEVAAVGGEDAPAEAVAGFEEGEGDAGAVEEGGGVEACEASSEDGYFGLHGLDGDLFIAFEKLGGSILRQFRRLLLFRWFL